MHPAVVPALSTFCASTAMAVYVMARRQRDFFHWALSGFLLGIAVWTGGVIARYTSLTEVQLGISVRIIFVGILMGASFWLLTAVAYAKPRGSPARTYPAVLVLAAASLFAMALFTNDGHRLFLRRVDFVSVTEGPRAYVGPIFWVFLSWAYGCVACGMCLYLRAARQMLRAESRRRGVAMALASAVPAAASTLYVFQLVPVSFDLTPFGLMIALILLWVAVFRYRLFESLPLARESVLTHLDDGVVMASASGRITSWSPAAERIFADVGLSMGERLAEAIGRLAGGTGAAGGESPIARLEIEAGQVSTIHTREGRTLEVTTAAVDDDRGEPAGQFAILSDRSEADRVERIARQAQRLEMVGALAAEVAHEINDPLTYVRANLVEIERLGAAVAAVDDPDDPDAALAAELSDLRGVAQETLEGVERIRRIVEGMRELSAPERGGFEEVDLAGVGRDALRLARLEEELGPVRVEIALPPMPPVLGNADRLVQVALNLLVNARQALAGLPDPWIRVEALAREGAVELRVLDNGPGISESVRDRVFDPFFTTRGPDEGTGLGLAIAFDIVREHDGVLEERSGAEGGACFALRLPVADGRRRAPASGARPGREVEPCLHH